MNAPIEPRHKDEAAEAAGYENWASLSCFIADGTVQTRILAHAQTLANLEKARADLAEIDGIAVERGWINCAPSTKYHEVATIAAKYRASDPVAEAFDDVLTAMFPDGVVLLEGRSKTAALAKFRAIIERTEDGK